MPKWLLLFMLGEIHDAVRSLLREGNHPVAAGLWMVLTVPAAYGLLLWLENSRP